MEQKFMENLQVVTNAFFSTDVRFAYPNDFRRKTKKNKVSLRGHDKG